MSLPGNQRLCQLQSALTKLLQWLCHGRKARLGVGGQLIVIETDDGQPLRHLLAYLLGMVQSTYRHVVIETEQG